MFLHSFLVDFQFICPSNSGTETGWQTLSGSGKSIDQNCFSFHGKAVFLTVCRPGCRMLQYLVPEFHAPSHALRALNLQAEKKVLSMLKPGLYEQIIRIH